ncbi:MAG: DNA repair protein RecO [Longimicrobiales bacterium]
MALVTGPALILQTYSYSETSKILRLLTQHHGVQSVIAKGALRPKSRFGGVLEPFTEGNASFNLREVRDLHTLSGFELTRSRQPLGLDLVRFGGASLVAELVLRVGIQESDPDLFGSICLALDAIERAPPAQLESTVLAVSWSLVALLGFAPALHCCLVCERPLDQHDEVLFDYTAGGVRCISCGTGLGGRPLPPAARSALQQLVNGEVAILDRTAAHWRLLDRFLAHHVLDGQTLHSITFLMGTVRGDK